MNDAREWAQQFGDMVDDHDGHVVMADISEWISAIQADALESAAVVCDGMAERVKPKRLDIGRAYEQAAWRIREHASNLKPALVSQGAGRGGDE